MILSAHFFKTLAELGFKLNPTLIRLFYWEEVMERLKKKSKEKYKFILKAGNSMRNALFRLFRNVWTQER